MLSRPVRDTIVTLIAVGVSAVTLVSVGEVPNAVAGPSATPTASPTASASAGQGRVVIEVTVAKVVQAATPKQKEQAASNLDRQASPAPFVPLQVGTTIDNFCGTTTTTTQAYIACVESMALQSPTPPAKPTADDAQFAVTQLLVELEIPDPVINIGPDPSVNEWKAAVIGYPIWLWTGEPATRSLSTTFAGSPVTMTARRDSVRFDMGDGSAPFTCTATDAYAQGAVPIMEPAPHCGYTFTTRNEAGINYTVSARAHWTVDWSAMGFSGTLALNTSAQRSVHVIELQSVVVAR